MKYSLDRWLYQWFFVSVAVEALLWFALHSHAFHVHIVLRSIIVALALFFTPQVLLAFGVLCERDSVEVPVLRVFLSLTRVYSASEYHSLEGPQHSALAMSRIAELHSRGERLSLEYVVRPVEQAPGLRHLLLISPWPADCTRKSEADARKLQGAFQAGEAAWHVRAVPWVSVCTKRTSWVGRFAFLSLLASLALAFALSILSQWIER